MDTKEIITLQLGNYANFIGAHWWNIQESMFKYDFLPNENTKKEINHDILFREGQTRCGEVTFTPRLVLADLKGGLASMKQSTTLYEDTDFEKDDSSWDGSFAVYKKQLETKKIFMNSWIGLNNRHHCNKSNDKRETNYHIEKQIDFWSDYFQPHIHPKSVTVIKEYCHMPNNHFDLWMKGLDLKNVCEELEEKIRFFAEECDHMQGFYVISDINNGFSGLSSAIVTYLHDEFSSKQSVIFPAMPSHFDENSKVAQQKREITCSLGLSSLLENSSVICPLALTSEPNQTPYLNYDASMNYHTSSIFASALDTATLNHRLKKTNMNLEEFCSSITSASKNIVSMSLLLPVPLLSPVHQTGLETLSSCLSHLLQTNPWIEISSNTDDFESNSVQYYSQMLNLRSVPFRKCAADKSSQNRFCEGDNAEDMLLFYLNQRFYGCQNSVFSFDEPLPTKLPFPQIFSEHVGCDGFLKDTSKSWCEESGITSLFKNSSIIDHKDICNHNTSSFCPRQSIKMHRSDAYHVINNLNPDIRKGKFYPSQIKVESVPVMTNITCSSKSEKCLRIAVKCLRESRKRHSMFHEMELESYDDEIERLCAFQDEYKILGM